MASIELSGIGKQYRRGELCVKALDGVSLEIEAGEFVAVVGRSGSGKTTLLDVLGLLMRPTSGTLRFNGVETAELSDRQRADIRGRHVGFIFQEYNLLPALNVLENVMLPLRYAGGSSAGGRRRALDLLEIVGLGQRLGHRPDQLSGGEQQRVAIARALINRPSLVLGDEPTGAVDTQTSEALLALMRRLHREEQVSVVIVTHDLDLAARTDRVIRLRDGRVVADEMAAVEAIA